jgi:hypothetical protein
MPVSDQEFAALKREVERLKILIRQLQGQLPLATASQEVPDG